MTTRQQQIDAVEAARPGTVDCFSCGQRHEATPSHWGQHDNRVIWAVVCPVDDLTDYYTSEVVDVLDDDPVPYTWTVDAWRTADARCSA